MKPSIFLSKIILIKLYYLKTPITCDLDKTFSCVVYVDMIIFEDRVVLVGRRLEGTSRTLLQRPQVSKISRQIKIWLLIFGAFLCIQRIG